MENTLGTAKIPRTTLKPAWKTRVEFEQKPIAADLVGCYCANQECDCTNITLVFFKAGGQLDEKMFEIVLNYKTWEPESIFTYNDDVDHTKLADEFMGALDDTMKKKILSGAKKRKPAKHVLRDDIDLTASGIDSMVCYPEVYRVKPNEELLFELGGKHYLVLDYYYLEAEYDANDVLLTFHAVEDNVFDSQPVLVYNFQFTTEGEIIQEKSPDITEQFAGELFKKLSESLGTPAGKFFMDRHKRIRKWRKEQQETKKAETTPTPTKAARNDPCPCGSGNKYKKCCGM